MVESDYIEVMPWSRVNVQNLDGRVQNLDGRVQNLGAAHSSLHRPTLTSRPSRYAGVALQTSHAVPHNPTQPPSVVPRAFIAAHPPLIATDRHSADALALVRVGDWVVIGLGLGLSYG